MTGSMISRPNITPAAPPIEHMTIAFHSTTTFINQIENAAAVIPTDWIRNEKSLATGGATFNAKVKTGNAIAAPPSLVAPAIMEPKTIAMVRVHLGCSSSPMLSVNKCQLFVDIM